MASVTFPSQLDKEQTRNSLESFTWNLALRSLYNPIANGLTFVMVGFALALGISPESIGWVASLLSFASLLQLATVLVIRLVPGKKRFVMILSMAEPLLLVGAVVVLPYAPESLRFALFALGAVGATSAAQLAAPLLSEWMASVIPAHLRGRYAGLQMRIQYTVTIVFTLAIGILADRLEGTDPLGLRWLLILGGLFGLIAVMPLRRASVPAITEASSFEWSDLPLLFRAGAFWRFVFATIIFNIPFWFACPYYQVFNISELHLSKTAIACMMAGYHLQIILFSPMWGHLVDRYGWIRLRWITMPFYIPFFLTFLVSTTTRVWPIFLGWMFAGVADSATGVLRQATLYASVPDVTQRTAFFAIANIAATAFFAIGSMLAVPVLTSLKGVSVSMGPFTLGQFQLFYAGATLLMIPCLLGIFVLPDDGKWRRALQARDPAAE